LTIAIFLKVNEGLVLASDSASTIIAQDPEGQQGVVSTYNNANKEFNLKKGLSIGVITWGADAIGATSLSTLIKDSRRLAPGATVAVSARRDQGGGRISPRGRRQERVPAARKRDRRGNTGKLTAPVPWRGTHLYSRPSHQADRGDPARHHLTGTPCTYVTPLGSFFIEACRRGVLESSHLASCLATDPCRAVFLSTDRGFGAWRT
jgi:hypothetical protein